MTDLGIFYAIYGLAHRIPFVDWLGIFFAQYFPYIVVVLFIFAVLRQAAEWRHRLFDFFSAALSLLLARGVVTEIIRFFIRRPRPFDVVDVTPLIGAPESAAFPSGHASLLFALAFSILFFQGDQWSRGKKERVGALFCAAALLVGAARVFAGVHWPLDIAGGMAVGLLSAFVVHLLLPKFH